MKLSPQRSSFLRFTKRLKREKGERAALEVYAQITRSKIVPRKGDLAPRAADVSLEKGLAMADAVV